MSTFSSSSQAVASDTSVANTGVPAVFARRAESRGSVLIFVVGVLLLLAIVATAFLSTSRSDRTATQQNAFNTQIDLLLEGVVNAGKGKISGDESIPGDPNFEAFDAYTTEGQLGRLTDDGWLASRVPLARDPYNPFAGSQLNWGGANVAYWPVVTGSVLGDRFESPILPQSPPGVTQPAYTGSSEYSQREQLYPTFMNFGGKTWPAFMVNTYTSPLPGQTGSPANQYRRFLAADADGDGVADSGLFRLPIGQLSGVTYFGAVRIIDNNSAVNLNTAMSRDYEFTGNGRGTLTNATNPLQTTPFVGSFPSSVGLVEMLRSGPGAGAPTAPEFDNMYSSGTNEFTLLNSYRFNYLTDTTKVRPIGVALAPTPSSPTPINYAVPPIRTDFSFQTMGEALTRQLAERMGKPGGVGLDTSNVPTVAKSAFLDSLLLASRFSIGSTDDANNTLMTALATSVQFDPPVGPGPYNVRTTPYDGSALLSGVDGWFKRNFDYASEVVGTPLPSTYMNRRTILTGYNATSTLDQAATNTYALDRDMVRPLPYMYDPAALFGRNSGNLYRQRDSAGTPVPTVTGPPVALGVNPVHPPMMIPGGVTTGTVTPRSKVSINNARFEELFYGFLQAMAQKNFAGDGLEAGTPGSDLFGAARTLRDALAPTPATGQNSAQSTSTVPGNYYNDPYIGMRFDPGTAQGVQAVVRPEPTGEVSVINGLATVPEQHPLRQFRNVLRASHNRLDVAGTNGYWTSNTPYLPADQVLLLRAAIAAANAEALRNNSGPFNAAGNPPTQDEHNDRITPHDIPLMANLPPVAATDPVNAPTIQVPVVAHVFGLRRQPYITEVFVDTDQDLPGGAANPRGYIAIKIYNPHPVPISLQYCRLVGLRRYREQPTATTGLRGVPAVTSYYPHMQVLPYAAPDVATTNDQLELSTLVPQDGVPVINPPYVIPAQGALVIENYAVAIGGADTTAALHRSSASLIAQAVGNAVAPANIRVAYLPYLSSVVYDRELVLMRPFNATPPILTPIATPTPLEYTYENNAIAPAAQRLDRFAPLDSYDFTNLNYPATAAGDGPARVRSQVWHYARPQTQWRFIYPGRYDANQSIPTNVPGGVTDGRPRQQGTEEAFPVSGGTIPGRDPATETFIASPNTLTIAPTLLAAPPAALFYPNNQFQIQLNASGFPSDTTLHESRAGQVNAFPYGGFRRMGDMLQVPFIGSYTIQTEFDAGLAGPGATFVEVNSVTMDAALAEDTDPDDDPLTPNEAGTLSREQIGRFCPLRPSLQTGVAVAEAQDASTPPKHWVFYNTTFINDQQRYQDDISDDAFRALSFFPKLPPLATPPATTWQTYTNRYFWTRTLFDHFTINGPQSDYFAAYPTQPKWQPGTAYVPGDAVQFGKDTFVLLAGQSQTAAAGNDDPPTAASTPNLAGSTVTWQRLERVPVVNNSATAAGDRNDIVAGGASFAYNAGGVPDTDMSENAEPQQGLVNLNTASSRVLAMLPWVAPGDNLTINFAGVAVGNDGVPDNEQIGRFVAAYRDGVLSGLGLGAQPLAGLTSPAQEPFRSIFDLYKVPVIQATQAAILADHDPLKHDGDLSLGTGGLADGVRNDFEEQFLLMNRVSNLITTRSDTFTMYVLVQGWRNVGTMSPELVAQRRAALIMDRSRVFSGGTDSVKQLSKVQTR